jgi:predicted  nucleic acid-binding Zn-ribbon protein
MHANLINTREDVKELQKDVKRHDREIASLDRRHADGTGKYTALGG